MPRVARTMRAPGGRDPRHRLQRRRCRCRRRRRLCHRRVRADRLSDDAASAAAFNLGLHEAQHEVVLLTNDDCTVEPTWVERGCPPRLAASRNLIVTGRVRPYGDPARRSLDDRRSRSSVSTRRKPAFVLYTQSMALHRSRLARVRRLRRADPAGCRGQRPVLPLAAGGPAHPVRARLRRLAPRLAKSGAAGAPLRQLRDRPGHGLRKAPPAGRHTSDYVPCERNRRCSTGSPRAERTSISAYARRPSPRVRPRTSARARTWLAPRPRELVSCSSRLRNQRPRPVSRRRRLTTNLRDRVGHALFIAATARAGASLSYSQLRALARIPSSYDSVSQWQLTRAERRDPLLVREELRGVLAGEASNPFSLGAEGLNFIDARIRELRPRAILEFGSGVSTVVLAARMADIHGGANPRVFSVEESETYLEATRRLVDDAGLSACVRLAHRVLRERVICGGPTTCYDLDGSFLRSFLELEPDVVLIDGPSGGGAARFGTLPLLIGHLASPCTFFLDDALREGEIRVAGLWRELPQVELSRIHLVGHGLLEGRIVR